MYIKEEKHGDHAEMKKNSYMKRELNATKNEGIIFSCKTFTKNSFGYPFAERIVVITNKKIYRLEKRLDDSFTINGSFEIKDIERLTISQENADEPCFIVHVLNDRDIKF